jgi:hypothetical protein
VLGETGTGKEVIARAAPDVRASGCAHRAQLRCNSHDPIESELFGARKGAFSINKTVSERLAFSHCSPSIAAGSRGLREPWARARMQVHRRIQRYDIDLESFRK